MTQITFEEINDYFVGRWLRNDVKEGDLVDALYDNFLSEFAKSVAAIKQNPKQKENLVKAVIALNYKTRGFETKNYSKICELFTLETHSMKGVFLIAVIEEFLRSRRKRRNK